MDPGEAVDVDYLTTDELTERQAKGWDDVLGVVEFSRSNATIGAADVPFAHVLTPALGNGAALFEVWRAGGPFQTGRSGRVAYRSSDHLLFGCASMFEAEGAGAGEEPASLQQVTECTYGEIFQCLEARGFPHLVRIWNYLPDINREVAGKERYQLFNVARQRAFLSNRREISGNVPAACALGSASAGPVVIYFLAANRPGVPIENPRQIAAYEYPPQYGPSSPTFSRATLFEEARDSLLFISGTSSIVGHGTRHSGNVIAQTRETMANIRALLAQAQRAGHAPRFAAEGLSYKVYLRHARDLAAVAGELQPAIGASAPIVFLQADICRADLLVEIEAVGRARRTAER